MQQIAPQEVVRVFIGYRQTDGRDCAAWLQRALNQQPISRADGRPAIVTTYFDAEAPAISDWREKWRADLAVCRAFILVCTPLACTQRPRTDGPDWLFDEMRWWAKHRKTGPILVDAWPEGECQVPLLIAKKWPFAQRVRWSTAIDDELRAVAQRRVIEGIGLSEGGIDHEELRRMRARNRILGAFALVILALAIGLGFALRNETSARADAERNLVAFYGPALRTIQQLIEESAITTAFDRLDAIPARLRGWEWRHVSAAADESVAFWPSSAWVNRVSYAPSGVILSGDANGVVRVHDPRTLAVVREAHVHSKTITGLVAVDDTHVVSAGYDDTVRELDLATGAVRQIATFSVGHVPLKANQRRGVLAAAGDDKVVRVFRVGSVPAELLAAEAFAWPIEDIAIAPDGETIAVLGQHNIALYSWRAKTISKSVARKADVTLRQISYSPDGARLLVLDEGAAHPAVLRAIDLIETDRGTTEFDVEASELQVLAIHGSLRAQSSIVQSSIAVSWPYQRALRGHRADVHWQAFSPAGDRLASAGEDGIRLWDVHRAPPVQRLIGGSGALAVSPDGRWVVGVPEAVLPARLRVWDLRANTQRQYEMPGALSVAFYPDGKRFAVGFESGEVGIFTVDSLVPVARKAFRPDLKQGRDAIWSVAISTDGKQLAAAGMYFAAVWNESDETPWLVPEARMPVAFSQYGRLAVGGSVARLLFAVWNVPRRARIVTAVVADGDRPKSLAFSPDGALMVSAAMDRVVIWSTTDGSKIRVVNNDPERPSEGAVFSPDGRRMMTQGATPVVWDVEGHELLRLSTPAAAVAWIGDRVFTVNSDALTIYTAPPP